MTGERHREREGGMNNNLMQGMNYVSPHINHNLLKLLICINSFHNICVN